MEEARILEREAHAFLSQGKFEEAFRLFKKAGYLYKVEGNHKQSALCFASAGGCWSKLSGEKTFIIQLYFIKKQPKRQRRLEIMNMPPFFTDIQL